MTENKKYVLVPKEAIDKLMETLLDPKLESFVKTIAAANFKKDFVTSQKV